MPTTDGELSLTNVISAVKQFDGSYVITHSGGTTNIPANICDNSGGIDAYITTDPNTDGDDFWDRLEKIRKKIWS